MEPSLAHMTAQTGHRQEYLELFSKIFDLEPSVGKVGSSNLISLIRAPRLFFGSLDDDYLGFFFVALLRALLCRRTVGLFLRPQTCFQSSKLRYRVKKAAFAALKCVHPISVFTIVPFAVAPDYAKIADAGVIDPQMWDKADVKGCSDEALAERIRIAAQGRRVLAFVGTANAIKGIEFLRDIVAEGTWASDKVFVVVAGRFPDNLERIASVLENSGALVMARFISDAELDAIYEAADLIWACYRPDYDQASGIFGRSVQRSKMPVVRADSLIARLARDIGVPALELDYAAPNSAAQRLVTNYQSISVDRARIIKCWKHDFILRVAEAL